MKHPLTVLVVAMEPRASEWAAWLSDRHLVRTSSDVGGASVEDADVVVSGRPHGDPTQGRPAGTPETVTVFLPPGEDEETGEALAIPVTDERRSVEAAAALGAYRVTVQQSYEEATAVAGGSGRSAGQTLRAANAELDRALDVVSLADLFRTVGN